VTRDRMQRQRFELKYVLNESKALAVREFVRAHLELDEAGVGNPDSSYRVNSLYLDSHDLYTFRDWVNANRNRFKLRLRFYDAIPDTPVFLEIKRRVDHCILKQRCGLRKSAVPIVLDGQFPPDEAIMTRDAKGYVALESFITKIIHLHARPKALVTYLREAYVGAANNSVRVTMDRQVRIAPRATADFSLDLDRFVQPWEDRVILELKFTDRHPDWFGEMVRQLQLTRSSAAKYCEGAASLWQPEHGNCPGRPRDGFAGMTTLGASASATEQEAGWLERAGSLGQPRPADPFAMWDPAASLNGTQPR
jgi:hypothetical protein